jgi:hypothetical protein
MSLRTAAAGRVEIQYHGAGAAALVRFEMFDSIGGDRNGRQPNAVKEDDWAAAVTVTYESGMAGVRARAASMRRT